MNPIILVILYIFGSILGIIIIFNGIFYGAMYTRIDKKRLRKIIDLGHLKPSMTVYDLGAGFGRIMLEAAKSGATVVGYETDWFKVQWINFVIEGRFHFPRIISDMRTEGWKHNPYKYDSEMITASIKRDNLLNADLSKADVVYCYLAPRLMQRIGEKALKEMKPGSKIITVEHKIPAFERTKYSIHNDPIDKIYAYRL